MEAIIERISQASPSEAEHLLKAIQDRYHALYPDWDLCIFSLEKSADRNEQLDKIIHMLQGMKTSP